MKNIISKIAFFSLVAVALAATPAISRADDSTNGAAAPAPAPKKKSLVFHGKVSAVDATAMTFTVGESTATVTSQTKIKKDGQPAVFADITVGETVACSYTKDDAGNMTAKSVTIGEKMKKKSADTAAPAAPAAPATPPQQ